MNTDKVTAIIINDLDTLVIRIEEIAHLHSEYEHARVLAMQMRAAMIDGRIELNQAMPRLGSNLERTS